MKVLLKKEAIELAIPATLLLATVTLLWLAGFDGRDVLVQPAEEPAYAAFAAAGLGGFFFALLQFYGERVRRTGGHLVHRGASAARVFGAKAIVGLGAAFGIAVLPPFVFALAQWPMSPFAPIFHVERVVEFVWIAAFVAPAYAIGAVTAQLRRGIASELLFGAIGALVVALIALSSSVTARGAPPVLRYVLVQLGIAAVLLVLAQRLFRRALDPDVALPSPLFRAVSVVGLVTFVLPVLTFNGLSSMLLLDTLRDDYSTLVHERSTGRFFAVKRVSTNNHVEVDSRGDLVPGAPVPPDLSSLWSQDSTYEVLYAPVVTRIRTRQELVRKQDETPWQLLNGVWPTLGSRSSSANDRDIVVRGFIDPAAGVLRFVFEPSRDVTFHADGTSVETPVVPLSEHPPAESVVRRPDGAPFSPGTRTVRQLFREGASGAAFLVFDAADHTFWRADPCDATEPIERALLPNGDRFVRFEGRDGGAAESHGWQVAVGERGLYAWDGDEFVSYTRAAVPPSAELDYRVDFTDRDPVSPRVEVRSTKDDALLRVQEYGPRGGVEWSLAIAAHAISLAQAPIFAVTSFVTSADDAIAADLDNRVPSAQPLFFGGRRPWLLLATLGLAALGVRAVVRRLRARGVDAWTTGAWALCVALLGMPALWWFLILEPRAKAVASATQAAPAPPMILCSEDRAVVLPTTS